ncbi:MAG: ATP-binding protein [Clostridiales bacterium]|nr:ATP-binding protein [Clostridiales bacterium]
MRTQKLPIGIENFKEMRKQDFYYVDKTGLIVDLLADWGKVNLFTRPRRFGKTLNMSMLANFFEIGADASLFDGLRVSEEKELCENYLGKFPVVFVSLKGVDGLTFDDAYARLRILIRNEAMRLEVLRESEKLSMEEKNAYLRLVSENPEKTDITESLKLLCQLLEKHYGQKPILLIDEYDVPLDKAFLHGYYPQMIDLIRSMFGAALKTNDSLFFAVLTGCLRVSKESIFTGLNNLKTLSISNVKFNEYFGFTDEEVGRMLADYGLEAHQAEAREWYDGYRFGNQDVYCPWDIINYVNELRSDPEAEPKPYWMNTSGNDMVRRLIAKASDGTTQMEIERLIAGDTITKMINEQLTHSEIDENLENIWSLLYMTGYLTVARKPSGGRYELRIPNREVREIFKRQVLSWFTERARAATEKLAGLYEAFEKGDAEAIEKLLNRQLITTVSFYDAYESFYHGFLLALLSTCVDWCVSSNAETGRGRSDITVERRDRELGFVIEIREVRTRAKLDEACAAAMKQAEDRDYAAVMLRYGVETVFTYGIAFCDKRCRVAVKRVENTEEI